MALNKTETLKLLKEGATIEFTTWGGDYPIYIRHGKSFDKVNKNSYLAIRNQLEIVKKERLSYVYKLKSGD